MTAIMAGRFQKGCQTERLGLGKVAETGAYIKPVALLNYSIIPIFMESWCSMTHLVDLNALSARQKIDLIDRLWTEVSEAELLAELPAETLTIIRERSAAITEDATFLPEAEMKKRIERLR
jgi:hypothetical protein